MLMGQDWPVRAYVYLCLGAMWQRVGVDSVPEVGQSGESSGESWVMRPVVNWKVRSVKGVGSRVSMNNKGGMCNI